jgi:hypothetical protein
MVLTIQTLQSFYSYECLSSKTMIADMQAKTRSRYSSSIIEEILPGMG